MERAIPRLEQPAVFVYPNDSILLDLTMFSTLFRDAYELLGGDRLAQEVTTQPELANALESMFFDGEYWERPRISRAAFGPLQRAPSIDAGTYKNILRTLRNGFAHFHWRYDDLSAIEYWARQGWTTQDSEPAFDLAGRQAQNYLTYIVDSQSWDPNAMWAEGDLRIAVVPVRELRFFLHQFLNILLNGDATTLFNHIAALNSEV